MNHILLITISGEDQSGVTAGVTGILAHNAANVLDIGQSVIHATLSLGILAELPEHCNREQLSSDIEEFTRARDLRLRISRVSPESYSHWVEGQGRARYIITLLARKITSDQLARVTAVVADHGLNI
ncbi:MAG: phosphoserine phosphatase SerB, partial [Halioglobus sp.]|nr:phosphoserine phosphatase SerB [Halioglobus sp.]